ncbi:MAG: hypothetical protein JNL80_04970 [Phycisphaerae bacterium]|jgi:hypothetical protein|nr:hypothetical protein [Phycisphaerae bacterium]
MWICPTCGEQLEDTFDACWHCAKQVSDPSDDTTPVAPPEKAAWNPADALCRGCGYDVRLFAESARCPECGTPVSVSRRSEKLVDADPHWLRTVRRGQGLVALAAFAIALTCLSTCVSGIVLPTRGPWFEWMFTGVLVVAAASLAAGAFMVSSLDPRESEREAPRSDRMIFRISSVIACVLTIAWMPAQDLFPTSVLSFVIGVMLYVTALSGTKYTAGIAMRLPDEKLANRLLKARTLVLWAWPMGLAGLLLHDLPVFSGFALVGGIATLISLARLIDLAMALRIALNRCKERVCAPDQPA